MNSEVAWALLSFASCFLYALFYQNSERGKDLGRDFISSPIGLSFALKHAFFLFVLGAIFLVWWLLIFVVAGFGT